MKTVFALLLIITVSALGETPATAQEQMPRIGLLFIGPPSSNEVITFRKTFLGRFEEPGYVQGKNIIIDTRYAHYKPEALPQLAAELVSLKVSAIVAEGPRVTGYAMKATKTIPIVMAAGGDPISRGFIESFNRPGGNVTGVASRVEGLKVKQMELYKETFP